MRILNIIDIPWHSGLAEYAIEQARALRGLGHEVFSAAPCGSEYRRLSLEENIGTVDIAGRRDLLFFPSALRLARFAAGNAVDVLNAHTGRAQTLAYAARLLAGKKFALVRTKADARPPRASFTYAKVSGVIAASGVIARSYHSLELPPGHVTVIPPGLEPGPYRPLPPGRPVRVGLLGRLDPVKGHADLIDAAALVLAKRPDTEFLFAGQEVNVKFSDLQAKAAGLGIAGNVRWLGRVNDPAEFMNSCHIGVIASTGSEVVSRALLEWMGQGRPVIGTGVGSVPELLDAPHIVPAGSPLLMAEALLRLVSGQEDMVKTGLANRKTVAERFSREVFAEKTGEYFTRLAIPA